MNKFEIQIVKKKGQHFVNIVQVLNLKSTQIK